MPAVLVRRDDHRQQRLGQPHHVPVRQRRLVAIGVAPLVVDRTENRARGIGVEERAGAIVDRLARNRGVVGVHHAMNEAGPHPLGHQPRLCADGLVEQRQRGVGIVGAQRVMSGQRVIHEARGFLRTELRGGILEGAHADMAARGSHQHCARLGPLPPDPLSGRDHCQRAGGGHPQRMHRLGHEELAQGRSQRAEPVAAARVGCLAGALEVNVVQGAIGRPSLAQQKRAAIAEDGRELPELVPRIGHRGRPVPLGHLLRDEQPGQRRIVLRQVQPKRPGQRAVEQKRLGRGEGLRLPGRHQFGQRICVIVGEGQRHAAQGGDPRPAAQAARPVLQPPTCGMAPARSRQRAARMIDKNRPARAHRAALPAFTPVPRKCQRHDGWTRVDLASRRGGASPTPPPNHPTG